MAKQGNAPRPAKDYDVEIVDKIYGFSNWSWSLGWCALVLGVIVAIATEGDPNAWAAVIAGLSAVLASWLLRGFALLVETSLFAHRSNLQIVSLLEHMHERLDRQEQTQQQAWAEDDFAKYSEE